MSDTAKIPRGKCIAFKSYLETKKDLKVMRSIYLKKLRKNIKINPKRGKRKAIKIREEINEIENINTKCPGMSYIFGIKI